MNAFDIWAASNGDATKDLYRRLQALGPMSEIGVALFRANKASARAKVYRGGIPGKGSYKSMAYERKEWSIGELIKTLVSHASELGIRWGWRKDPNQEFHSWVIYVDLPGLGQVSFHAASRGKGPDYPDVWDGKRVSTERICKFCDGLLPAGTMREESTSEKASLPVLQ